MTKSIEEIFIDKISPHLLLYSKRHSGAHRFASPCCQPGGVSTKGKKVPDYKAAGFLYRHDNGNTWNFKCHVCGRVQAFEKFLEKLFPREHFEYVCQREQLGTTGFQTNCPSLETLVKKRGMFGDAPSFRSERVEQKVQKSEMPPAEPVQQLVQKSVAPQALSSTSCKKPVPPGFKLTIESPMRSPQQQAGHQSPLNYLMNQRQKRRRERDGW
jgi:hypothetical protein